MRIRTDTVASAASLAEYLRRCECIVEAIDGRILDATAPSRRLLSTTRGGLAPKVVVARRRNVVRRRQGNDIALRHSSPRNLET
jgi:hypothetical protein